MKVKFIVEGLDCPHCAIRLGKMIAAEEGITDASINFLAEEVTIETELDEGAVFKKVKAVAKTFSKSVVIKKK